ncbi:hypothetical protein FGE12_04325 [Aggregicoccus sp. 17bor-14]|uniref:ATP-grasp domain-containing protein n=1 Tax=Myxococcaceae TaxID=31 RepID=UPI00129CF9A9|nr:MULTISPECIES: hypothetical protein [Myxococcaceae]MBF5041602.1 hypothetical protein [Simulacricoccus sp. 17bor-14]MRI87387.1 hypothetical protein [Aggregicoccus sp. 17bor-14]
MKPIAILHEHPDWFRPLFHTLERRRVPYVRLDASAHVYDPRERHVPYSLVFNRASPSAYLRGHSQSTFHTQHWLRHLRRLGVPVVNGARAYETELSKALQLELAEELNLPTPRARVFNHPSRALEAAAGLRFPVLVKANVGGSGAGIRAYGTEAELARAVEAGTLELGPDGTALLQELAPLQGGHITRVELLGGKFLYAINVYPAENSFNLCPADVCQTTDGAALARGACALDAPKNGMRVEAATPPPHVIWQAETLIRRAGIDVGGIEYLVDARDGQHYFYDVNALSNFVADPLRVVGFDPFERLVDFLVARAEGANPSDLDVGEAA